MAEMPKCYPLKIKFIELNWIELNYIILFIKPWSSLKSFSFIDNSFYNIVIITSYHWHWVVTNLYR